MEKMLTEAQVHQMIAKENQKLEKKQQQREENVIRLGARVIDLQEKKGSAKVSKDGQPMLGKDNEPLLYPSTYKVTIQFFGGSIESTINETIFSELQVNRTYFIEGYFGMVKDFGKESIQPIFNTFTQI